MLTKDLEHLDPSRLQAWKNDTRTHSKKQVRQIADSIKQFGFNNPILIDEHDRVVAGHGRVAAAKLLDMKTVPCLRLDHMTEAEKRAYVIADNKLAENAGWDEDLLAIELGALCEHELDFDVELTGFDTSQIDLLIDGAETAPASNPKEDALPPTNTVMQRCRPGDLWQLGKHRLMCTDARNPLTIRKLMGGVKADMVFTDPPYNVKIDGNVCGSGAIKHREFAMASGEMNQDEFTRFLRECIRILVRYSWDAQSISSAWTGATCRNFWMQDKDYTANSRT